MPTIHREHGFRFVIHTDDHKPMHIPAVHADGMARIDLCAAVPVLISVNNLTRRQVALALEVAAAHMEAFRTAWRGIHG